MVGTHGVKMADVVETKYEVADLLYSDNVKTYSYGNMLEIISLRSYSDVCCRKVRGQSQYKPLIN